MCTPFKEIGVQFIVSIIDVLCWFCHIRAGVYELGFKWNGADTTPRASVHGINCRKRIAQHKDFTRNFEFRLVLKESTCFYIVFTCELLHARSIERLTVIRFGHIDKPLVANRHDIWIRCTRFRSLTCHSRRLKRRRIITKNHRHQVY